MIIKFIIWYKKITTKWSEILRHGREIWLAEHRIIYNYNYLKEQKLRVDADKKNMDIEIARMKEIKEVEIPALELKIADKEDVEVNQEQIKLLDNEITGLDLHIKDRQKVYEQLDHFAASKRVLIASDKEKVNEAKISMQSLLNKF